MQGIEHETRQKYCFNLAEIGSTYNNKYKGIKRESQLVQNSNRTKSKRAHTIHTCAHLEYSGIHKYSYMITIFIIITFPPLKFGVGVQNDQQVVVHE